MNRIKFLLIGLFVLVLAACSQQAPTVNEEGLGPAAFSWTSVGGALDKVLANQAALPSLAVNGSAPVVAFQEAGDILVRRAILWNGVTFWLAPEGPLDMSPANNAASASLALTTINNAKQPVVAWEENCIANAQGVYPSTCNIYVKQRTGNNVWTALGGPLETNARNPARFPSLASWSNRPAVAFSEIEAGNWNVYVKYWTGSVWKTLGAALDINIKDSAYLPSLAVNSAGRLVVAWSECDAANSAFCKVYVKRWNGLSWVLVGGALNINLQAAASAPSAALDSAGIPTVAWQECAAGKCRVYVKRWGGAQWLSLGGALNVQVSSSATNPSLTLNSSGKPIVAFQDNNGVSGEHIFVRPYLPSGWNYLGLIDLSLPQNASDPSLVVGAGNILFIAWEEDDVPAGVNYNVYAKKAAAPFN